MQRLESGDLLGRGGVQALELGVCIRAAQDSRVQHTRAVDVITIFGASGRLLRPVEALDFGADQAAFFWPSVCHGLAPFPFAFAQAGNAAPHLLLRTPA